MIERFPVGSGPSLAVSPEHLAIREKIRKEREDREKQRTHERNMERGSPKLTLKSIEFALRTHGGNITDAAHFLGTTPKVLRQRVEKSEKLQGVIEEMVSQLLDYAENVVAQSIFAGNVGTSMWYLKTKGKDRGYSEKVTGELEIGEKSMRSADELIKAMREGARELKEASAIEGGDVKWLEPKQIESQDQTS